MNDKYVIQTEIARAIAVGVYRDIGTFIATYKLNHLDDYERYQADYIAKQALQAPVPIKRPYTRNRPIKSR